MSDLRKAIAILTTREFWIEFEAYLVEWIVTTLDAYKPKEDIDYE